MEKPIASNSPRRPLNKRFSSELNGPAVPPLIIKVSSEAIDKGSNVRPQSLRLITRKSSDWSEVFDASERTSTGTATADHTSTFGVSRINTGLERRPLATKKSGDLNDSPKRSSDINAVQKNFFPAGGNGLDRPVSQRLAASNNRPISSPKPALPERINSQRGLLESPREMVRVVSQRALTSQVAEKYLQGIEQQRAQKEKANNSREEKEQLVVRKKTAKRMLGSFSMYQLDVFAEVTETKLDDKLSATEPRLPSFNSKSLLLKTKKSFTPEDVLASLDDEFEASIFALLDRRTIAKAFLMWRTVVSYRSYVRASRQKLSILPNVAFGRRRSRRQQTSKSNKSNNSRASRLSVVRRPSTETPTMSDPHPEWFDMGARNRKKEEQHRHQLNMGRRNTRTSRASMTEQPSIVVSQNSPSLSNGATRLSTRAVYAIPTPVPEDLEIRNETKEEAPLPAPSPIYELERTKAETTIPRQTANRSPPPLSITILHTPKGLQRKLSWGKKGMEAIKHMFSVQSHRLLTRVPSKEKLFEHADTADRLE